MAKYIEREAAMNAVEAAMPNGDIYEAFMSVSTVAVRPVVRGQWIEDGDNQPMSCDKVYCCSNCKGNRRFSWQLKPFCEMCGADMREVPDDG